MTLVFFFSMEELAATLLLLLTVGSVPQCRASNTSSYCCLLQVELSNFMCNATHTALCCCVAPSHMEQERIVAHAKDEEFNLPVHQDQLFQDCTTNPWAL